MNVSNPASAKMLRDSGFGANRSRVQSACDSRAATPEHLQIDLLPQAHSIAPKVMRGKRLVLDSPDSHRGAQSWTKLVFSSWQASRMATSRGYIAGNKSFETSPSVFGLCAQYRMDCNLSG